MNLKRLHLVLPLPHQSEVQTEPRMEEKGIVAVYGLSVLPQRNS